MKIPRPAPARRDPVRPAATATLHALPGDPVAAAAVHFHAWRVAHRAARGGAADAAPLRDAHGRRLREALRENLTSLHRLCIAAGEDCDAVGQALDAPG